MVSVSLGLPYPLTGPDQFFWQGNDTHLPPIGFTTLELEGEVNVDNISIYWTPSPDCQLWLRQMLFSALRRAALEGQRLLTRLALRGSFVLGVQDERGPPLDGDVFRTRSANGFTLPSGDGHPGGTLDLWFWLAETLVIPPIPAPPPIVGPILGSNDLPMAAGPDGTGTKAGGAALRRKGARK